MKTANKSKDLPDEEELVRHIMLTSSLAWKNNITRGKIEEWLSNFKGEVYNKNYERRLALWLLTNFVYYNEDEVRHLCKAVYHDYLHYLIKTDYGIYELPNEILNDILRRTLFVGLGRAGESGGFISYYFRKENNIPINNFYATSEDVTNNIKQIVFIDDVTLSEGKSQAIRYLKEEVDKLFPNKRIILLTLIASKKAILNVQEFGYEIINSITLSERNQCFTPTSNFFEYYKNHLEPAKKFSTHYGKKLSKKYPLGHKNAQLLFGFFYNTPNNTLPIFWKESKDWNPIIRRYLKNQNQTKFDEIGRFI